MTITTLKTHWKRVSALAALATVLLAGSAVAATRYFGSDPPNCPPTPDCPCHHAGGTAHR